MNHNISYQIRTYRNAPVFSYESLDRAKEEKLRAEKRVGCKMKIVKITCVEEEIII